MITRASGVEVCLTIGIRAGLLGHLRRWQDLTAPGRVVDSGNNGGGAMVVHQRVVHETGGAWTMPTLMNYADQALLMQVMMEAHQLWVIINDGTTERETDRTAMECLLRSLPPKMVSMLAVKATAKDA